MTTDQEGPVKATVSKGAAGLPPTRASRSAARQAERRWYLEATVVLRSGSAQIERVERNNPRGRRTIDQWAMARVQHSAVDYISVEQVVEPTRDRAAGYLTKSERPTQVIGLPDRKRSER